MSGRLDGTTAMITGASSGIGAATARALVAEGAAVALLARRKDRLDDLGAELGAVATVHEVDVTDPDAVAGAVEEVVGAHGSIDVLVNNAGYGSMVPAAESDLAEWRTMVDVNINGVLATTHAALGALRRAAAGSRGVADVVTVSSVAGRKVAGPRVNVYAATKHAVGAFTESLRQEFAAEHVRVALVEPGLVRTELTERDDLGAVDIPDTEFGVLEAADVADAILYVITRPARTAISEVLIRPTEQER